LATLSLVPMSVHRSSALPLVLVMAFPWAGM
jgi:hypothetical protein